MASQRSSNNLPFDEDRWVIQIRSTLEEEVEEDVSVPVCVFCVPKTLLSSKPEAYVPQLFALGPYHHWQPQLYEMERYKLATAKRTKKELQNLTIHELVDKFTKHEYKIRSYYHRYLDLTGETLAWMMAIDASFLLEFLRNYSDAEGKVFRKVPSMSHMVDAARIKLAYNSILRDVVMLENQIPLILVRKIFRYQNSSTEIADCEFSIMLIGFVKEVSPFKSMENFSCTDVKNFAHLLQLLYYMIVPKEKGEYETPAISEINLNLHKTNEDDISNSNYVKKLLGSIWNDACANGGPIILVKKVLCARPIKFLVKIPWKIISNLPVISILKQCIESLFLNQAEKAKDEDSSSNNIHKPPLVEEIMIPSVTDLSRAGIKFSPVKGELSSIKFNVKTATLYLPTVSLDVNTEVLLRNLVAYETSVEAGPMVFTRYTELMNGIIDSEEDVKLLGQSGIILNHMKSDEEVANLWNGMSRSVRLSKVQFIDKVLEDVNRYYNSRWSVKSQRFMKKYVFGSWQFLAFVGAFVLLIMSCVQAFCSVYNCRIRWFNVES